MTVARLVVARARASAGLLTAAAVLLLAAASVVTAGAAFAETQATAGLRRAVAQLPPEAVVTTARARQAQDPAAQDAAVREQVRRLAAQAPVTVSRSTRGGLTDVLEPASAAAAGLRVVPHAYDDLPAHADLVAGRWQSAPAEASLHADAARALGVEPGDRLVLQGRDGAVGVDVVGTWRPREPADPFFAGDPLETTGTESPTVAGPLVVDAEAVGLDARPSVRWRVAPDAASLRPEHLPGLSAVSAGLRAAVTGDPRVGSDAAVSGDAAAAVADLSRRVGTARSVAALPVAVVAALAGATLLLVARLLAAARERETVLVRSRGASAGQVAGWTTAEGLGLAVPAALLAPVAGVLLARAAGAPATLDAGTWATGAVAAVVGAALLLVPSVHRARRWSAAAPGRSRRAAALRRGADVVLLVLAAIGLWQLSRYRAVAPTGQIDLVLVAAPALALAAGSVLAARLLPLLAALGDRLLAGRPGLVGPLAAWDVARRPDTVAVPTVLVAAGVAAGVLAAGYTATTGGLRGDAAVQQVGADVRVVAGRAGAGAVEAGSLAGVPGVAAVTAASSGEARVSSTELTLTAVDSATAEQTLRLPAGTTAALVRDVRPRRDTRPGLVLPEADGPVRVRLVVERVALGDRESLRHSAVLTPSLWLAGSDGAVVEVQGGPVDLAAPGPREVDVELPAPTGGPWSVVALDLQVPVAPFRQQEWFAEVGEVTAAGRAVPLDAGAWRELDTRVPVGLQPPEVSVTESGPPRVRVITPGTGQAGLLRVRVGPAELDAGPVPAVIDEGLAAALDVAAGDVVTVTRGGADIELEVVRVAPAVPGATGPAALADLGALTAAALAGGVPVPPVDTWFVALESDAGPDAEPDAAAAALRGAAGESASVTAAALVARGAATDPLAGTATGAFGLALVAAAALAGTGLAVSATRTARARRRELAALRALGATSRQLRRVLVTGQVVAAAVGLAAGLLVGLAVALLTLPSLVPPGPGGQPLAVAVRFDPAVVTGVVAGLVLVVVGAVGALRLGADRVGADRLGADR